MWCQVHKGWWSFMSGQGHGSGGPGTLSSVSSKSWNWPWDHQGDSYVPLDITLCLEFTPRSAIGLPDLCPEWDSHLILVCKELISWSSLVSKGLSEYVCVEFWWMTRDPSKLRRLPFQDGVRAVPHRYHLDQSFQALANNPPERHRHDQSFYKVFARLGKSRQVQQNLPPIMCAEYWYQGGLTCLSR